MKLWHFIGILLAIITTASCKHSEVKSSELNDRVVETGLLGFGVKELMEERKTFDPKPLSNYYYGQLYIKTNLYKAAVSGADARTLRNYVLSIFGSEKQQFGLTVSPVLNGVKFPEIVVFSYKYDSSTGSWKSDVATEYSSPVFLVSDFERVQFEFKYVASDSVELNLTKLVSGLVLNNADLSPGAWVVSKSAANSVKLAAASVDNIVSSTMSKSEETGVKGQLEPSVKGDEEIVYRVGGDGDHKLADISFRTRLFTSLVSGSLVSSSSVSSDYRKAIPKLDPINNPLNRIKVKKDSGGEITLDEELRGLGLIAAIGNSNSPDDFSARCRGLINKLQGQYGLTVFDSLNSMRHVLLSTKFTRDSSLYHSGCLTDDEFGLLRDMGVPIEYKKSGPVVELSSESLKKVAGYLKSPVANDGFRTDILNMFSDSGVRVASVAGKFNSLSEEFGVYYKQDFFRQLGKLRVATSCCWGAEVLDGDGVPIKGSGQILFRTLDYRDIYALELYPSFNDGAVDFVRLRRLDDSEISTRVKNLLLSPAKPQVEGFQSDVVLSAGL